MTYKGESMNIQIDKTSHIAAYIQVRDKLKERILKNEFKPGEAIPKLREICEWSNVSLRTAQKAVNELIKSNDCRRVGRRFVVNNSREHDIFAICDHAGRSSFKLDYIQDQIISGIRIESASRKNCENVFLNSHPETSIKFFHQQFGSLLKGVILLHWQDEKRLNSLAKQFPYINFVQVNYRLADFSNLASNIYGIFNDDYSGAYQVADYFVSQGIKKPIFIEALIDDSTYKVRRKGFLSGLIEHDLKAKVFTMENNSKISFSTQIRKASNYFEKIFSEYPEMDAILCCNDIIAEGVGSYLQKNKLLDKIKLVGYDDYTGLGQSQFSSVAVNYRSMGKRAIKLLTNLDNKPKIQNSNPQLIIRHNI